MSKNRAKNRERTFGRVLLLVILAAPTFTYSEPRYQFTANELTITLHDDACTLKSEITNLPRRVVWKHKGEVVEGCWGFMEQFGLVTLYFADKTATAMPSQIFQKITST